MASAFKCDRCGELYDKIDHDIKFTEKEGTYISNLCAGNRDWNSGPKDLCPNCARDFKIWWEHSNISAQYQLAKIASEMNSHEGHSQDTE